MSHEVSKVPAVRRRAGGRSRRARRDVAGLDGGQAATPPGLHVSGTQLVEKDGTPFVARGVSHAHTWYTSQTATAIPAIRAAGANALRVVLANGDPLDQERRRPTSPTSSACARRTS